jgi:hypothetical protein
LNQNQPSIPGPYSFYLRAKGINSAEVKGLSNQIEGPEIRGREIETEIKNIRREFLKAS